jgi:ligand-binding SRPBCC domain-containing protein
MTVHRLETAQRLPAPPEKVFPFFSDARNLERITPARLRFRVLTPGPIEMRAGTVIEYRLRMHRIAVGWRTEIVLWDPPRRFVDVQRSGPYRLWHHTHSFEPAGGGTLMRDVVRYALPLGPVGVLAHAAFVRRDLERIFDFRGEEVARLLGGMGARA